MNWWNILDIDYNSDLKTIKIAYAKLLKSNNPEDNPEGYQKLRQAYDMAIKNEKRRRENPNKEDNIEIIYKEEKIEEPNNLYLLINGFLERLNEIYNDKHLRIDIENWLELMNQEVVWNVESSSIVEDELFNFISKHKFLLTEVWELFETNYHWSSNELELYKRYDKNIVDEIINLIKCPYKLNSRTIENIDEQYLDEYLLIKVEAYRTAEKGKYYESIELINKAKNIYFEDPDLIELYGFIMIYNQVYKVALSYLKEALELDNTKIDCTINIGVILVALKKYEEAILYLERYLKEGDVNRGNNLKIVTSNLGHAYYYINNYEMAKYYFEKALKLSKVNNKINKYLNNIDSKLQGKKVRQIKPPRYRMRKVFKSQEQKIKDKKMYKIIENSIVCITVLFVLLGFVYMSKQSEFTKNTQNNKTQESLSNQTDTQRDNESDEDNEGKIMAKADSVGTINDFLGGQTHLNYSFYLSNITEIDLYAILKDDGVIEICNEKYLKNNNLSDQIYCNVFIGSVSGENILLVDKNFTMELVDKNGGYTVSGRREYSGSEEPIVLPLDNGESITIYNYFIYKPE
jgi:tetratricopeptide (TPR) repeat protein